MKAFLIKKKCHRFNTFLFYDLEETNGDSCLTRKFDDLNSQINISTLRDKNRISEFHETK